MACSDTFTKTVRAGEWLFQNGQAADCAVLSEKAGPAQFLQNTISRVPDWEDGINISNFCLANEKRIC